MPDSTTHKFQTFKRGVECIYFSTVFTFPKDTEGRILSITCLVISGLLTLACLFILERTSPSSGVLQETENQDQNTKLFRMSSFIIRAIQQFLCGGNSKVRDVPPKDM